MSAKSVIVAPVSVRRPVAAGQDHSLPVVCSPVDYPGGSRPERGRLALPREHRQRHPPPSPSSQPVPTSRSTSMSLPGTPGFVETGRSQPSRGLLQPGEPNLLPGALVAPADLPADDPGRDHPAQPTVVPGRESPNGTRRGVSRDPRRQDRRTWALAPARLCPATPGPCHPTDERPGARPAEAARTTDPARPLHGSRTPPRPVGA